MLYPPSPEKNNCHASLPHVFNADGLMVPHVWGGRRDKPKNVCVGGYPITATFIGPQGDRCIVV